jgi:anti-sigma regulatory factor (Ser/Thr protein kinase)
MMTTPPQLRLRITSDPAHLAPVRHQLEGFCAACGFDEESRGQIVLVVNEALANITRHAYGGAEDGPIEMSVEFADGLLRIEIRDWGTGRLPPEHLRPRDPLQPGGVGLVCLRELMDNVTFSPQPDGMLLTLERRLAS